MPFHWFEWRCERIAYSLAHWALLDILDYLGRLTILVAVVFYVAECDNRRQAQLDQHQAKHDQRIAKHYQTWQTIALAQGKPGSGGRIQATQELNREGVSLEGVDMSGAYLVEVKLPKAQLKGAKFQNAILTGANFQEANLDSAKLQGAKLRYADLRGTNLSSANLREADLI